jgi:hypothetical protein
MTKSAPFLYFPPFSYSAFSRHFISRQFFQSSQICQACLPTTPHTTHARTIMHEPQHDVVHEVKEQSNNTKQTTTVTAPLHPTIDSADVDVGAGGCELPISISFIKPSLQ